MRTYSASKIADFAAVRVACEIFHKRYIPSRSMERKKTPGHEVGAGHSHLTLGFTFAAGVMFFLFVGLALDKWLGVTPLFTVGGAIGGSVLSFLNVYWKLEAESQRRREKRK
jgi:F0F1-type ATP synthase assembly protein I